VELVSSPEMLPVMVGSRVIWPMGAGLPSADVSRIPGEGMRSSAPAATPEDLSQSVHSTSAKTDGLPETAPSLASRIFDESSAFARSCFSS